MTEKRHALIIANYQYEDTDLRQLIAPVHDADALARVLKNPAIGDFDVKTLLNMPSHEVRLEIETFFSGRKRDDLLLFYFSGHGVKDEDGQLYLSTTNTKRKLLRSTAIEANFVNNVMQRSRSRMQVLLLDCCYSGAFARGMLTKSDKQIGTKEYFEGMGRVVLTASDSIQYAFEGDQVEGKGAASVFTNSLVHGLETGLADRDADGHVDLDELYDYVHDRVIDETPNQRPSKWNFGVQGKIIIAHNLNPIVKSVELPVELQDAIENPLAGVRKGAVAELEKLLHGKNKGLALSAHEALKRMKDDDSRLVNTEADRILKEYEKCENVQTVIVQEKEKKKLPVINKTEAELSEQECKEYHVDVGTKKQPRFEQDICVPRGSIKWNRLSWLSPRFIGYYIGIVALVSFYIISNSGKQESDEKQIVDKPVKTMSVEVTEEEIQQLKNRKTQSVIESAHETKRLLSEKDKTKSTVIKKTETEKLEQGKKFAIKPPKFRSNPNGNLSETDVQSMLKRYNFFCQQYNWNKGFSNPNGDGFYNNFKDKEGGEVIFDDASGLMWQQYGSDEYMTYNEAKAYITRLNSDRFAGHSDWRLPTLEEAMSLLEPAKKSGDLYIDPVFDGNQSWIWTSDFESVSRAWVVYFLNGSCYYVDINNNYYYVRAVR